MQRFQIILEVNPVLRQVPVDIRMWALVPGHDILPLESNGIFYQRYSFNDKVTEFFIKGVQVMDLLKGRSRPEGMIVVIGLEG